MSGEIPGISDDDSSRAKTTLMHEVAAQMDAIEDEHGENFVIDGAVTVVVVKAEGSQQHDLRVRNVGMSPLEAIGILSMAQDVLKAMAQQG